MNTLDEAIRIGTKDLIADRAFFIKTLEIYLKQELKNVEERIKPIFCRAPSAQELLTHLFKESL